MKLNKTPQKTRNARTESTECTECTRLRDGFALNFRKAVAMLCILALLIIPQAACTANENNKQNTGISKTGFYLDTLCSITIFGIEDADGNLAAMSEEELQKEVLQLITDAFKLCDEYEKLLSKTIESSDIAKINKAEGKTVEVNERTAEVIRKGIEYGKKSNGAFDITIGKATELWGFREAEAGEESESGMTGKVPSEQELAEAMSHVDYSKVSLDGCKVQLSDPETELDLGGIAKGYIADRVTEYLESRGVVSAIVDLGGNIAAIGGKTDSLIVEPTASSADGSKAGAAESATLAGSEAAESAALTGSEAAESAASASDEAADPEKSDGELAADSARTDSGAASRAAFTVGIKDPSSDEGTLLGTLPIINKTVVTSGTYERYFIEDGKKYHHILDTKTGYPTDTDVLSVTIIADKGHSVDCDGLSTSCLALGLEKGMKLIEETDGTEAVFVDTDGKIYTTSDAIEFTAY